MSSSKNSLFLIVASFSRRLGHNYAKRDCKRKMKNGIDWISGVELYLLDIYLMFLSREIDIKLCQNYTKTYICKIYVRIMWPKLPPMAVQYTGHVIQYSLSQFYTVKGSNSNIRSFHFLNSGSLEITCKVHLREPNLVNITNCNRREQNIV